MVGRCRTCRYWDTENTLDSWDFKAAGMKRCIGIREAWNVRRPGSSADFDSIEDRDERIEAYEKAQNDAYRRELAVVQDGSEYMAMLYTGPDFGCVKHEAVISITTESGSTIRFQSGDKEIKSKLGLERSE